VGCVPVSAGYFFFADFFAPAPVAAFRAGYEKAAVFLLLPERRKQAAAVI
jgi:hypothetical protein